MQNVFVKNQAIQTRYVPDTPKPCSCSSPALNSKPTPLGHTVWNFADDDDKGETTNDPVTNKSKVEPLGHRTWSF